MPAHNPDLIELCASFTDLFDQLGLPSTPEKIADFVTRHHPLPGNIMLVDAPFWTASQAQFLREMKQRDEPPWSILIDQLSEALRS